MTKKDTGPRFRKMKRTYGKPFNMDAAETINMYWRWHVAHVSNDDRIVSKGQLVNGVPEIANDRSSNYKHDDIVWVHWDGRSLKLRGK